MPDLTVYFVAPEQDLIGDGDNCDMFVAANSAQEAADLFVTGLTLGEVDEPIRIYRTPETVEAEPGLLEWDGRRDLHAATAWAETPIEMVTPTANPGMEP